MSGRRTNLALAVLLSLALLTGAVAFAAGTGWGSFVVILHGVAGLALMVLVPWKLIVVRRGWRRGRPGRILSALLGVLVAVAVVSGVFFATGTVLHYGPLNAMQVHVGAALAALPLAVVHLVQRPVRPRRADLDRRAVLHGAGVLGVAAVAWLTVEGVNRVASLPGARRRFTGSREVGSFRPQAMPTTQWLDDSVPDPADLPGAVTIRGNGASRAVTVADLAAGGDDLEATLDCTSGWYSTQRWGGTRLDRVLAGLDGAGFVVVSATGYRRRFPRADASRYLLATHAGGEPLSPGHGAPVRLAAPGRRGFWWVKWVVAVEVDDRPWWLQLPFPPT